MSDELLAAPDLLASLLPESELRGALEQIEAEAIRARRDFEAHRLPTGRTALRRIEELAGDALARAGHPNPSGRCLCGCDGETSIASQTIRREGLARGAHRRYLLNHQKLRPGEPEYQVDPETGCWVWQRALNDAGYGQKTLDGQSLRAHRAYYELLVGPVPEGLELDHLCRNRACVNPAHLEPVTRAENVRRGTATKLTAQLVAEIRENFARAGGSPYTFADAIHDEYGVAKSTMVAVLTGRTWRGDALARAGARR